MAICHNSHETNVNRTITREYDSQPLADMFAFGFSTKCRDRETGLVAYQRRFYSPGLGRWLTRDPIGEDGGENLYAFCGNNAIEAVDYAGFLRVVFHRIGESPRNGWGHPDNIGVISVVFKLPQVVAVRCGGRKQGYKVSFTPRESRADIYLHESLSIRTIKDELEHVQCAREYDKELDSFKNAVEAICECSETAESLYRKAADRLKKAEVECEQCNARLDAPGGPHGH